MVVVYPSAVFLIPLIIATLASRKCIPLMFILTTPFFSLIVFEAVGHQFTLPEVGVVFLIIHLMRRDSDVVINRDALIIASTFIIFGIASSIILFLFPTDQVTSPYNSRYIFFDKHTSPLIYSKSNLTQALLRCFSFMSIFIIYLTFSERNVTKYTRILVFEGLIVGAIGILYQIIVLFEIKLTEAIESFGFLSMNFLPPFLGPLPQLMSVPGEPGYTALYFLFLLGITTSTMISDNEYIFSQSESAILTILFVLFIFLTGSGTGFGGIMILGAVIGFYYVFIQFSMPSLTKSIKTGLIALMPSVTIAVLLGNNLRKTIYNVLNEITFQGGSGGIRLYWIEFALTLFQTRPFIGYGFGSYYGLSVFGTILVSTGIIGLCLFFGFHGLILRSLIRKHHSNYVSVVDATLSYVFVISLATIFATMLFSKSITALLFPWYWVAVGFSLAIITDGYSQY